MMQEIPLHSLSSRRPQEISVIEGPDSTMKSDGVNFSEAGGGITVQLENSIRNVCWRAHHNMLEIFEYSLDVDLYGSSYVITFEGSKVLPWVHVAFSTGRLHIACCTLHAVHNIVLDMPNIGGGVPRPGKPQPSLLSSLSSFDFGDSTMNCYFDESNIQGEMVAWTANTIMLESARQSSYLSASILNSQGNLNLIRMTARRSPSIAVINQVSRVSRMLAGINPWADTGGTETIVDMKIVNLQGQALVMAICSDKKLRIWSFDSHDVVFNHDISHQIQDEDSKGKQANYKITFCPNSNVISIFAVAGDCGLFLQYKIGIDSGGRVTTFNNISVTSAPLHVQGGTYRHLVDFNISSNILTALWRDVEENDAISICEPDVGVWHDVALYPSPAQEVPLPPHRDVRESYMDYIFFPGRFSPTAIKRTLSIRQRVASSAIMNLGCTELKERVAMHIQSEIQDIIPEDGADDDAVQLMAWNNFYQNLVQYQQVVSRAVGLSSTHDGRNFLMTVVKKGCLSVLGSVSVLESVCRGCSSAILKEVLRPEQCTNNNLNDIGKLLENLGNLHGYLGVELLDSIQQNICLSGSSPFAVVTDLIPDIVSCGNAGPGNLLEGINDVDSAVRTLLDCLEPVDAGSDLDIPDAQSWPAGTQGIEVISRCVLRHLENRFQLSILLLVTLSISESLPAQDDVGQEQDRHLVSRAVMYIQSYKALAWVSSSMTQNVSQGTLENVLQTLSLHDPNMGILNPERARGKIVPASGDQTVLEYFISGEGGKLLQALLQAQGSKRTDQLFLQQDVVQACVNTLVYLIWPWGPTLALQDFMLNRGQFAVLQKYLQGELREWCSWCLKSREYMLGHCHLHTGNYSKAVKSFIFASSGIGFEEYLGNKLLKDDEESLHPVTQEMIYYTKILPIFERLELSEQVIVLAQQAIESTKMHEHHQNLPILWSSIFRQSNNLNRHEDALKAIVLNPDGDHKKDCLRTLAVSLCERKEYKILVEFQYAELENDLADILEHRARGTDLLTSQHNYYDLLYAFHVQRGNFRKAASAMYEQAYRIGCEFSPSTSDGNIKHLQKQLDCLAACINCLYLVDEENRWILHPVRNRAVAVTARPQGHTSPKRLNDGELRQQERSKVVIHELKDIRKESILVEMRMKLEGMSGEPSVSLGPSVTATEVSSFLCHAGLYDDAIAICSAFNMALTPIFSSLAAKCVRLSYADDKGIDGAWEWLQENETVKTHCTGGQSSVGQWTVADAAYRLLQVYLERHGDAPGQGTRYYYASAKALFGLSATLPAWFADSYKKRNCPELLRLLVCFDRLAEATMLAAEMLNLAKSDIGTQYDVATNIRRGVCLPYTILEQLLETLQDLRAREEYDQLYRILCNSFEEYLNIADTVSGDILSAHLERTSMAMLA